MLPSRDSLRWILPNSHYNTFIEHKISLLQTQARGTSKGNYANGITSPWTCIPGMWLLNFSSLFISQTFILACDLLLPQYCHKSNVNACSLKSWWYLGWTSGEKVNPKKEKLLGAQILSGLRHLRWADHVCRGCCVFCSSVPHVDLCRFLPTLSAGACSGVELTSRGIVYLDHQHCICICGLHCWFLGTLFVFLPFGLVGCIKNWNCRVAFSLRNVQFVYHGIYLKLNQVFHLGWSWRSMSLDVSVT